MQHSMKMITLQENVYRRYEELIQRSMTKIILLAEKYSVKLQTKKTFLVGPK